MFFHLKHHVDIKPVATSRFLRVLGPIIVLTLKNVPRTIFFLLVFPFSFISLEAWESDGIEIASTAHLKHYLVSKYIGMTRAYIILTLIVYKWWFKSLPAQGGWPLPTTVISITHFHTTIERVSGSRRIYTQSEVMNANFVANA